jgi:DNA helicase IV
MTRDIADGKRARIQDWDALIIDEGQDFDQEIYEELEKDISQDCHIAIFSDKNQSFLKNGVQPGRKNSVLNPENNPLYSVYDLKRVIRSNALIAKFAAEFIEEKVEYKASNSFPIEIVIAESEAALIETADKAVIKLIEQEGWLQGEIALIRTDRNPTNIESQFSRKPRWDLLHLRNEIISTTSLGIKGLEREVAVVVINNYKGPSITNKRKIYTAITRAKLKLVIVCTQTTADELFTGNIRSD